MPELDQGTVESDRPPVPALPAAAAAPYLRPDGSAIAAGQRWNRFTLETVFQGGQHSWLAEDAGNMEKVLISARLIGDGIEWRRRTWAQLCAIQQVKILRCLEAIEENGWRYEILAAPPPTTLREWLAAHRPGFEDVEGFVRQLAPILDALHGDGLVHLNVRPETLYIVEGTNGPEFLLGGLQSATLFHQPELIPINVDPFYAPPEAAGLVRHSPGPQLCNWDWWSLGRVVQELLLGQHVLGFMLKRDVSLPNPDLRTKAESLLLEREPPGVRAGAVEQMGAEPAALPLLRGLLTACGDGRWRADSVGRWLRHESVRDYYDQPRTARLWSHGGRVFTLKDAVEFFTQPANWAAGEDTLLRPDEPATLANFLRESAGHRDDWERLRKVIELAGSPAWADVPELARRTITVAVAWLALSCTAGSRTVFRVRGNALDAAGLTELLHHPGGAESVALLRALLHPPVMEYVDSLDPVAARVLKSLAARAGVALKTVLDCGWLGTDDHAGFTRLFSLALQRATTLQERVTVLQATYATSRHPELARMLASRTPTPVEYVILAFTGETPEQCGLVTHAESRNERYHALKAESDAIAGALRWVRLQQLLERSWLWGARWPIFVATVGGLALLAGALDRSMGPGLAILLALAGARAFTWWRVGHTLRRCEPAAAPWSWRDGSVRAAAEARRVLAQANADPARLVAQAQTLRAGMAEFAVEARRDRPTPEPHWWDLTGVFVVSALIALGAMGHALAGLAAAFQSAEPSNPMAGSVGEPIAVRSRLENADRSLSVDVVTDPDALLASGRYEIVDDGFGRRLRGPLQRWDLFSPAKVPTLVVRARATASPEQAAFALVSATLLLRPYIRDSVTVLLAITVPTTRGTGLVIFNGRDGGLLDREVRLVDGALRERTWYELDHRRVFFLGSPMPLDATNSLAPP